MKSIMRKSIAVVAFSLLASGTFAQGPPPPPSEHGSGGNQSTGGTASLTSGIGLLLTLGAAYGGKKVYRNWKNMKETLED